MLVSRPILGRFTHDTLLPVVHRHLVGKDNTLVGINRCTILLRTVFLHTIDVPVHRHLNLVPATDIIRCFIEVLGTFIGIGRPVESPFAIQRLPILTVLRQYFPGLLYILKGEEPRMRLLLVQRQRIHALPFPACRCLHRAVVESFERSYLSHKRHSQTSCCQHSQCSFTHKILVL